MFASALGIIASSGVTHYVANAITYDFSTIGRLNISNILGSQIADSPTGLAALYFRVDGGAGTYRAWMDRYGLGVLLNNDNTLEISFTDFPTTKVKRYNFGVVNVGATWHDVIFSWDTSSNTFYGLLDGVTTATQTLNQGDFSCGWSGNTDLWFGSGNATVEPFNSSAAQQYLDVACPCINVTNPTILAAWRDPITGKPVDLGPNGELLSGSQPLFYMNGTASTIGTNKGSHGNLTIQGTITNASSSPSD